MQAKDGYRTLALVELDDSMKMAVSESYPLHLGSASKGVDGEGITETEWSAKSYYPSSLPEFQIQGEIQGTSCNNLHVHSPQTVGKSASASNQDFQFLSVIQDAGFIPSSATSDVASPAPPPSFPSMPLDPFYADWPHWDFPAVHLPHPLPSVG
jgi:hypothetical protein